MIKVVIDSLRQSLLSPMGTETFVALLKEADGERYIPMGIASCDFYPLMIKLRGEAVQHPLTYDFFAAFIRKSHLSIRSVYIHTRLKHTFQAEVRGARPGVGLARNVAVNCRGIDALMTAVHFEVPIYVSEALLAAASMTFDTFISAKIETAPYGSPGTAKREGDTPCP